MATMSKTSSFAFCLTLIIAYAFAAFKVVTAQNATTVCKGVGETLYATELEREHNPCNVCEYDANTRRLVAECRYDYCEACDKDQGFCGVKVVRIDHTLTEQSLGAYLENQAKLDLGTKKTYCIDYSDGGPFSSKVTCVDIDDSFNTNCEAQYEDLPFGLPLLTCDEIAGCQCAVPDGKSDTSSPFIGFEKLKFDSCFVEGSTSSSMRYRGQMMFPILVAFTVLFR